MTAAIHTLRGNDSVIGQISTEISVELIFDAQNGNKCPKYSGHRASVMPLRSDITFSGN